MQTTTIRETTTIIRETITSNNEQGGYLVRFTIRNWSRLSFGRMS